MARAAFIAASQQHSREKKGTFNLECRAANASDEENEEADRIVYHTRVSVFDPPSPLPLSLSLSLEIILAAIQAMPGIAEEFANIRGIFIINEVVRKGRGDRYLASSSKS